MGARRQLRKLGFFAGRHPRVMGHRGAAGIAPENTILSFRTACEQGADILEMDVRLTADKHVVVCHDPTVNRTTNGHGRIKDLLLSEVNDLDAAYRFSLDGGKSFPLRGTGITIPTLNEVLETFPDIPINIEIKEDDLVLVQLVMSAIELHKRFPDVLVTGSGQRLMDHIRLASPTGITGHSRREAWGLLAYSWFGVQALYRGGGQAVQLPSRTLFGLPVVTPRVVRTVHDLGLEIHTWTVNEVDEMKRLLAMGVDGIFTDHPARLRALI